MREIHRRGGVVLRAVFGLACVLMSAGCEDPEAAKVNGAYNAYEMAGVNRDAEGAVRVLTRASLDAYVPLIKVALDGKEEEVRALPPSARLEVLQMRARGTRAQLAKLDGPGYVRMATAAGWYSHTAPENPLKLEELKVHGDWAVGKDRWGDRLTVRYYFLKEEGAWKLDEVRAFSEQTPAIEAAAREAEMTVDELLLAILEDLTGVPPPESIWKPMVR